MEMNAKPTGRFPPVGERTLWGALYEYIIIIVKRFNGGTGFSANDKETSAAACILYARTASLLR